MAIRVNRSIPVCTGLGPGLAVGGQPLPVRRLASQRQVVLQAKSIRCESDKVP